jgi:ferric-dicitrate binding protein FerR (iron transport regulator)
MYVPRFLLPEKKYEKFIRFMKEITAHELEALLQKYYNGETSLPEEKLLKLCLSQKNIPATFTPEQQWFSQLQQEKQVVTSNHFDQQLEEKLTQIPPEDTRKTKLRPLPGLPYRIAALLLIFIGLGFVVYISFIRNSSPWVDVATAERETKEVVLPDGSKVWLNGESAIRYARQSDASTQRKVWLEGEAYFEVSHNPRQPFVVHTQQVVTQVLGTSFNIRGYADDSTVEVGVLSGKVAFSAQANELSQKLILQPGHGAVFSKVTHTVQKTQKINPNLLAWKTHQLVFEDAPLHEVIATLENYFDITIKAQNSTLLNCRFKGTFKEAQLAEILKVMQFSMSISTVREGDRYIISGNGC